MKSLVTLVLRILLLMGLPSAACRTAPVEEPAAEEAPVAEIPGAQAPLVEVPYQDAPIAVRLLPGQEHSFQVAAPPGTCVALEIKGDSSSSLQLALISDASPDSSSQAAERPPLLINYPSRASRWFYQPVTRGKLEVVLRIPEDSAEAAKVSLCSSLCPSADLVSRRMDLLRHFRRLDLPPHDEQSLSDYKELIERARGVDNLDWLSTSLDLFLERAKDADLAGGVAFLEKLLEQDLSAQERLLIFERLNPLYWQRRLRGVEPEFYDRWQETAEEAGNMEVLTRCLVYRAYFHRYASELGCAVDFAYQARSRLRLWDHEPWTVASVNQELGETLTRLGRFREAACFLQAAADAVEDTGPRDPTRRQRANRRAKAYNTLAFAQHKLGNRGEATQTFEQLEELYQAFPDAEGRIVYLDRWGTFLQEAGQFDAGRDRFQRALQATTGGREDWMQELDASRLLSAAYLLHNLAALETESGNVEAARLHFRDSLRALCLSKEGPGAKCLSEQHEDGGGEAGELERNGGPAALATALGQIELAPNELAAYYRTMALIERESGQRDKAIGLLEQALDLLKGMHSSQGSGSSMMEFDSARHPLFVDPLISLLWQQDRKLEALLREDVARGRQLSRMLSLQRSPDLSRELLEREKEILRKFAELDEQRQQTPGDGLTSAFTCSSAQVEHELDQVRAEISMEAQRLSQDISPAPLNWDEIREELLSDPEVLVLYYSLGRKDGYVWILGSGGLFQTVALSDSQQIEGLVDSFHRSVIPKSREGTDFPWAELRSLSRILLRPALQHLKSKSVVVVVADGALARIPFHLLPHPGSLQEPDGPLLGSGHDVASVASLSIWRDLRRRTRREAQANKQIAILGDPIYNRGDDRIGAGPPSSPSDSQDDAASGSRLVGRRLYRLPRAGQEAKAIKEIVSQSKGGSQGVLEATGEQANRDLFLSGKLDGYPILHFAIHADIHPLYPEFSNLVLAHLDRQGRTRNPYLRAYEIARRPLAAELVVLSACRSGDGLTYQGEGVVGLTQSFFAAGARRAVVSLWDVDDEATKDLMIAFYKHLFLENETAVRALRLAQEDMLRHSEWGKNPFYYAGFMVQGDWKEK